MIIGNFCFICGEGTTSRFCLNYMLPFGVLTMLFCSLWRDFFLLFLLVEFVDASEGCVINVNFNYNS